MGRLQTARLENFIRRWGSIKGGGSVLSESLGDVFPVLDLENLTPELQALAGWYPFFMRGSVIGVAAQLAGISCINPAESGAIVIVDGVIIRSQATGSLTIGTAQPLFTAFFAGTARDTRLSATTGMALLGANANVGAAENGLQIRVVTDVDAEVVLPNGLAVLAPGTQVAIVHNTVDVDITASFFGRARLAEPSELSF